MTCLTQPFMYSWKNNATLAKVCPDRGAHDFLVTLVWFKFFSSFIYTQVFCLVVLGSAISKISGTMAELRAMNEDHFGMKDKRMIMNLCFFYPRLLPFVCSFGTAGMCNKSACLRSASRSQNDVLLSQEHSRQRREIRVYLTNQKASFELVSRIMKFVAAQHKMGRSCQLCL